MKSILKSRTVYKVLNFVLRSIPFKLVIKLCMFLKFVPILLFFWLYSRQTHAQPTFSDNCQLYNTNSSICQQCNPGFYLQFFFCITCNPNCACSSKLDFCQSCLVLPYNNLNFYSFLDQTKNQCFLCNSSLPFCLQCHNLNLCTKCYNGQYIFQEKDLDGVVIGQYCSNNFCASNCQICEDKSHCKICQQGFFLFANKTCSTQPCTSNCSFCQSVTECQVCAEGFYLEIPSKGPNSCQACQSNCTACTIATNCTVCAPGTNLAANGTCTSNGLSNCVEYTNDFTNCTGCEPGYQVTAGSCNQCTGCELCTEQFICLTPCQQGYQPFNFACIPSFGSNKTFFVFSLIIFLFFIF